MQPQSSVMVRKESAGKETMFFQGEKYFILQFEKPGLILGRDRMEHQGSRDTQVSTQYFIPELKAPAWLDPSSPRMVEQGSGLGLNSPYDLTGSIISSPGVSSRASPV